MIFIAEVELVIMNPFVLLQYGTFPGNGYAVLRIKIDNTGLWLMHCHIELHEPNIIAIVLNEFFHSTFPMCRDFKSEDGIASADQLPVASQFSVVFLNASQN